ncbi:S8 family serine peptidase [Halalkalibacter akibai]|uniref:Peptidase S8/S53 domain-containing protein n=1 Tax=Halalkalibacter akibai (strain ATCC 43226 / DSM 21942 / CIP 109018 / JCM 9157 / 1139) TaxID=1236973 RepID=W4QV24_HALA3|nr:S8 family serine peptidase [Halalkalibacter akibai]GAE35782.1 hypothetical protein JCM9157_2917 [Halalkalibacter akibai JCM 9157]
MSIIKSTYRWLFIFILICMIYIQTTSFASSEESNHEEVIVVYNTEAGKKLVDELALEIEHQFEWIPAVVGVFRKEDLALLRNNRHIDKIEENSVYTLEETLVDVVPTLQDHGVFQTTQSQWNIHAVKAKKAWDEGVTGKGVRIAVVDTGISPHPQLNIFGGVSTLDYTTSWSDDNGHGTHVAGTIGARNLNNRVIGVAPEAQLFAVKALNKDGIGSLRSIMQAIEWSIANQMDIINFSLGTNQASEILEELLNQAQEKGILIVGASGNTGNAQGTDNSVSSLAKYEPVIAVGAVSQELKRASFSSTGKEVEFSAPGVEIFSTYLNGQYAVANGTSQATPHISGILALLKQKYPTLTNKELRSKLQEYALDLGLSGRDSWYGYGFVVYSNHQTPKVSRIEGVNLYETSALVSKEGWTQSDYVIMSRGDRFQDALAGVPLAAKYDAPLLLSRNNRLDQVTKNELARLGAKKVIILGGHLAIDPIVDQQIKQLGIKVERIAGANAHETAELISKKVAPNGSYHAIIVSDTRFQDALSVASYAGVRGIPILLANTKTVPKATERAIQHLGVQETLVIGGELAITDDVANRLPKHERLSGRTRFDTNIKAFQYFAPPTDKVYIATSERFQDGLSGAALAAKENVGVLLVGNSLHNITKDNLVYTDYNQIKVLGGELAINANVYKEIKRLVE